jgi:hypothetical protein
LYRLACDHGHNGPGTSTNEKLSNDFERQHAIWLFLSLIPSGVVSV